MSFFFISFYIIDGYILFLSSSEVMIWTWGWSVKLTMEQAVLFAKLHSLYFKNKLQNAQIL